MLVYASHMTILVINEKMLRLYDNQPTNQQTNNQCDAPFKLLQVVRDKVVLYDRVRFTIVYSNDSIKIKTKSYAHLEFCNMRPHFLLPYSRQICYPIYASLSLCHKYGHSICAIMKRGKCSYRIFIAFVILHNLRLLS